MKTKIDKKEITRVDVSISEISRGDVIYLSKTGKDRWLVIDVGQPYILIENLRTHFATLYHAISNLYKEK